MSKAAKCSLMFTVVVLIVMLFSAYSNTFYSPPVLDDFHSFVFPQSLRVHEWSAGTLKNLGQTIFGWGRWVPILTFSWDLWLGQGELFFLHLTNLIIHSLCFLAVIFLVFQISKSVQRSHSSEQSTLRTEDLALWVAGLWALHPVQTNAVTYLVQRMASLVALFCVLSVAFYVAGRLNQLERKRLSLKSFAFYLFSFFSMIFAFLCKQNAAMLPILLFCTEAWFFTPDLFTRVIAFSRKHRLVAASIILFMSMVLWHLWPQLVGGWESRNFTPGQRLLTEARVVVWYISILLYPHPGRLSLEHDTLVSTSLFHPISTLFSILLLVGLTIFAIVKRRRFPLVTYGIVWFLLNLAIESSFLSLELVFEHRLYLPSVGLILTIVVILWNLTRQVRLRTSHNEFRKLAWCVMAILAATLSLTTFERNNAWQNGITLNQDNVLKAPRSPRAHANLGLALYRDKRYQEAQQEARTAIELGRKGHEAYFVAANVLVSSYMNMGDYETAIAEGERLLKEKPPICDLAGWPNLSTNLSIAYANLDDIPAAYATLRRGLADYLRLPPNEAFFVDGAVRLLKTTLHAAKTKGIALDPALDLGRSNASVEAQTAQILLELGYRDNARKLIEESVARNGQDELAMRLLKGFEEEDELNRIQEKRQNFTREYLYHPFSRFNGCMALAFLIQKKGLPSPFLKFGHVFLDHALEMKPDSADAHLLNGWYLYAWNESEEAAVEARKALDLDPDNARAWLGLGFFLTKAGQIPQAVAAFQRSLELYPGCPERRTIAGIVAGLQEDRKESHQLASDEHVRTN